MRILTANLEPNSQHKYNAHPNSNPTSTPRSHPDHCKGQRLEKHTHTHTEEKPEYEEPYNRDRHHITHDTDDTHDTGPLAASTTTTTTTTRGIGDNGEKKDTGLTWRRES